jgi:hypothetical protein
MSRKCEDCGMDFDPRARNQKRCTPCRVLRDLVYWSTRGERDTCLARAHMYAQRCVPHVALESGDCWCSRHDPRGDELLEGTPTPRRLFKDPDPAVRAAALQDAQDSLENRKQYATMSPDPQVPARGSSEYEALTRRLWDRFGEDAASAVVLARHDLRAQLGDAPIPQYLAMAAALEAA